jgi:hypothetical protein
VWSVIAPLLRLGVRFELSLERPPDYTRAVVRQANEYNGIVTIVQREHSFEVNCAYEVMTHGGITGWRGSYSGAQPDEPEVGDAELKLANGNAGQIMITNVFKGTGDGWFIGNGAPPYR